MNNRVKLCFFDDYWIDFRKGTIRRWFEPEFISSWRDPMFDANSYCQLICDRELGRYRLYYEAAPDIGNDAERRLALAETKDLIEFTFPKVNDSKEERMQHVVFPEDYYVHGSSVFFDPYDNNSNRSISMQEWHIVNMMKGQTKRIQ